jgi:hypothetical protein
MAFPTSPTNGQQANVNGITYTYSSARTAWTVTSSFLDTFTGNALIANSASITNELSAGSIVSGNILPAANNTYSLGNATTVWTDLYLANSTIYLGEATIGASGANLILPSTVQIGNAVLTESGGSLAMPENMTATTMSVSGNITGSYFLGNGALLSGITVDSTSIQNGNSNVQVQANGTVNVSVTSTADVAVFSTTGVSVVGNITGGNITTGGTLSAVTIVESSSITLKENIRPIEHPLESILQLLGVMYDRKDGSTKNEIGLLAEDVYKIIPNIVSLDDKGNPAGVMYTKLSIYLLETIKKLHSEVEQLKRDR